MLLRSFAIAAMVATSQLASTAAQSSSYVRGAAANNNSKDHSRHRVLQEEEEFTFLIADIQYEDGVAAASRKLQGNSQGNGNGNGLGNNPNKPERTINVEDANGIIYEIEEGSGDVEGIQSGAIVTLPPQATLNSKRQINLGGASLKKKPKKANNKRDLQEDDSSTELRRHLATTGTKTVVAVRVIAANAAYGFSEATLSDEVFGTSGDGFNLKKGYEQCSHNQLTINPGGSAKGIVNGVTTITVSTDVTQGDVEMRNAVTAAINTKFGVSNPTAIANHWMYCLPPGTMSGIAYAFINSWMSVYSNEWCNYPSGQIHELGHNFGYAHSNEGTTNYGDQSGMMGYSYGQDEGPVMCFNAAKSWQTGWFDNKRVNMNIGGTGATDNCFDGEITGQSDYNVNTNQIMLVKMNRSAGRDLFLMYNKKTGINSGTVEGGNLVTIVEADGEGTTYGESWLVAKLGAGQIYTASNYLGAGKDLVITVLSIGATANVRIEYDGLCTNTMAPTPAPCPGQKQVTVQIKTDNYPTETSWTLKKFGSCVGQTDPNLSVAAGSYTSANTVQVREECVDEGQYQFIISDTYGDGICCGYGTGTFQVLYGGIDVFPGQGGNFGTGFTGTFGECNAAPTTPPPTPAPVNPPTAKPTPVPTKNPTAFPTNPPPTPNPTTAPPTTPPTPNPTPVPTNPPTNAPTNPPTFPPPTSTPTPPPTPPPVSTVYKFLCAKNSPLPATICADGFTARNKCTDETKTNVRCGSGGKVCWWAECAP